MMFNWTYHEISSWHQDVFPMASIRGGTNETIACLGTRRFCSVSSRILLFQGVNAGLVRLLQEVLLNKLHRVPCIGFGV